jgi:integrase
MGRRRRKNLHLPKRMQQRRGKFYFIEPESEKWIPLGDDYSLALTHYGRLAAPLWTGRVLSDVFTRYKTEITALVRDEEARENEIRTLDRFNRVFGHMRQDSLTQQQLYQYMDNRLDERKEFAKQKKKAPSAGRHDVRFLKKVLTKGIKWGAGTVNPVLGLEFDADPANERDVTDEEFAAVYQMANPRMRTVMDAADLIGQRRGDILGIRRADLQPDGIHIRQGKTGAYVVVEWSSALREVVDRALAMKPDIPRDYVFRNGSGRCYTKSGFNAIWQRLMRRYVKQGGIRFKFRDIRAKAATDKAIETDELEAQKLMGHTDISTTRKHYIKARGRKPVRAKPVR